MGDIIQLHPVTGTTGVIDYTKLANNRITRTLEEGVVLPVSGNDTAEIAGEHTAEPIKSIEDIKRISEYLVSNGRYRDNMLFIVGINFGLRVSDLLRLRFNMVLDETLTFRDRFPILEKKTANTRKVRRNRYITINDSAIQAITLYIKEMAKKGTPVHMDDYLFRGESNRCGNQNKPMNRVSVDRILKSICEEVGVNAKVSTHTLRKTFGYHQMVMSGNDPRKLLLLQKIFGHSTVSQTLDYIGITREEIEDAYLTLNLGGVEYYNRLSEAEEQAI